MKRNIYLIGMPGCGKSALGAALAEQLDAPFADMDALIEERVGCTVKELFAVRGEDVFRRMEHEALVDIARQRPRVVSTGGGVILWPQNRALLRETGLVLWIDRPLADIQRSIRQDTRPLLAGDAQARLHALFAQREALYRDTAHARIDNSGSWAETLDAAIRQVKESQCSE